uniref:aspartate transaminase n=1 Tax=Timema monikensis TaxID=170555 RepID=A0A7R9HMY4_9NEOP|nr:unnamed protein product [Timema monikensis]
MGGRIHKFHDATISKLARVTLIDACEPRQETNMECSGESRFDTNCVVEANEIERLRATYFVDTNGNKIDLIVGAYRDENGNPWPLPVVRKVEEEIAKDMTQEYEYLWALGDKSFTSAACRLLLGGESMAIAEERVASIQSVSGTGALWMGAKYISKVLNYNTFYMSSPTWNNHRGIFESSGLTDAREYRYWDPASRSIDMEGLLEDLRNAPKKSVIILQACSHNPTGLDPTRHQWSQIVDVLEVVNLLSYHERGLMPFLDCAYQGFASGDIHQDAWTVRYFEKRGLEFITPIIPDTIIS